MDASLPGLARQFAELRRDHPQKMLEVRGVSWRYTAAGAGPSGLVLFPGAVGGGEAFVGLVPLLADRYRMIMLTIPNVPNLDVFLEGLDAIVSAERIDNVAMVGSSFGGMLAQAYLFHHPERTTRMVLSATAPPRPGRAEENQRWHWVYGVIPMPLMRVFLRLILRRLFRKVTVEREFWRHFYASAIAEFTRTDLECRYRLALEFDRRYTATPSELADWTGSMLILQGDADSLINDDSRELMQSTYPQATIHRLEGAGHGPLLERPVEWLETVSAFLTTPT